MSENTHGPRWPIEDYAIYLGQYIDSVGGDFDLWWSNGGVTATSSNTITLYIYGGTFDSSPHSAVCEALTRANCLGLPIKQKVFISKVGECEEEQIAQLKSDNAGLSRANDEARANVVRLFEANETLKKELNYQKSKQSEAQRVAVDKLRSWHAGSVYLSFAEVSHYLGQLKIT